MGATAILTPAELGVAPGAEVAATIRVRNTGAVVDEFTLEAVGVAQPWAVFEPPKLSLFPGAEGSAEVTFKPPRESTTPAGTVPFAIRVASREDPAGSVAEEGVLQVEAFHDVFVELIPRTGRGRRHARFNVAVDNRGNTSLAAGLAAVDPDDQMVFAFKPPALTAAPGAAAFSVLDARPRKTFLRGPAVTRPFIVKATPEAEGSEPSTGDATLVHEAIIPRWLPRAIAGLAGAVAVLAVLWLALLKPEVKSTATVAAQQAVAAPLAEASKQIADLAMATGQTVPPPIDPTATTVAPTTTVPVAAVQPGQPTDGRLEANASRQVDSYTVPDGKVLSLTDLVIENPAGDSGELRVQRGGATLLILRLENFRDLDYHFVTPVTFSAGQVLTLRVTCANEARPAGGGLAGAPAAPCTPGLYFNGLTRDE